MAMEDNPEWNPLVRRVLFFTGLIVLAEPLAATMLLSFVAFMVRDFPAVDNDRVAFWCGLLTSAYFVAQVFTAPIYGILSDRIGRKPVLLFGLVGSAVCTVIFGTAKNTTVAIVSRVLCGVFNGNAGVSRTAIGELAVNHNLHQGRAFALFGFCTALGTLIGPLLGGFLCQPAEKYRFDGPGGMFKIYPYLLPCLIGAGYNITIVALSVLFLPETNIEIKGRSQETEDAASEETPLLPQDRDETTKDPPKNMTGLVVLMLCYLSITLHVIAFDDMYPVVAATLPPIGLGYTSIQVATTLLLTSPVLFAVQLIGYPILSTRFSYTKLWGLSSILFLFVYLACPFAILLPAGSWLQWSSFCGLLAIRISAVVIGYTSLAVLLALAAPPNARGATVSIAQAVVSASRAVGPALAGALWSWGLSNHLPAPLNQNILFLFMCLAAALQVMTTFGLSFSDFQESVQSK
ncbi:MFS general substrate transporter [Dissoconium aciculare CBS 342.82]|uniref:MFS general substrate transporter n=1 Tax=Dissoconium aciculare CBS 342.82 TaxID=1314786 RepID=A0A6J3LR13_9PEZI|nr:MFS general substrate transporter [Dissoconium aciculare CBS 342.82]KAF1818301.1 MFS general substrate transporter [Dissoconium aciculare CBS 342.82]